MKFSRSTAYGLAVLSGLLMGFSGPPYPTGFLATFGLVPVLLAIDGTTTLRQTFSLAYLSSLFILVIVTYWALLGDHWYLLISAGLFFLAYPIVLSIPLVLWRQAGRTFGVMISSVLFPFLWVAVEYMQTLTELTIPFVSLAHSQTYNLPAIQLTSLTGVSGLSFLLCVTNMLIFILVRKLISREWRLISPQSTSILISIALSIVFPFLYGAAVLHEAEDPAPGNGALRVALIQPDIDPYEKWAGNVEKQLSALSSLTQRALHASPDLVIWSETAIPLYILRPENDSLFQYLQSHVRQYGVPLLTGYTDWIEYPDTVHPPRGTKFTPTGVHYDIFNAAMLIRPDSGVGERYFKIILLPFFERVPFVDVIGSVADLDILRWNFGTGGYRAGHDTTVFTLSTVQAEHARFGVVICYESIFSEFVTSFTRRGAEFIVIITNDSWWGNSAAPYQHRQFAVLRAVENRRWVVRCANGGISCVVDPYGRVAAQTRFGVRDILMQDIHPRSGLTFYVLHGDWVGKCSTMVFCIALVGYAAETVRRRFLSSRARDEQTPAAEEA